MDREVHQAASFPEEGLEREPPSCLDLSHDLRKHNETGPLPEGEYSSLVEEVARRSRDLMERRALQEETRRDFHQKVQAPIATSSPAGKATEPVAELSLNMKVLGDSVKQLVDLQHKNSQGMSSPRTYLGVHQLLPLIESFAKNESTEKGKDWSTWKSDLQDLIDYNHLTIDQVKQILRCKLQGEASAHYKSMPNKKVVSIDASWTWMDDRFINLMHRMKLETRLMKMVQR
ncbi:MAG: hypothetical protein GY707_15145, partial [Desulfobacteraceae bacterium]|nr:hypothetical protein [Desulfobacteraceae bacterium]